jgi:hypothetical protein
MLVRFNKKSLAVKKQSTCSAEARSRRRNEDEDEQQDKGMLLTIIGGISCGEGEGKRSWKHAVRTVGRAMRFAWVGRAPGEKGAKPRARCSIKPLVWVAAQVTARKREV